MFGKLKPRICIQTENHLNMRTFIFLAPNFFKFALAHGGGWTAWGAIRIQTGIVLRVIIPPPKARFQISPSLLMKRLLIGASIAFKWAY